jgi:hypothetical protein
VFVTQRHYNYDRERQDGKMGGRSLDKSGWRPLRAPHPEWLEPIELYRTQDGWDQRKSLADGQPDSLTKHQRWIDRITGLPQGRSVAVPSVLLPLSREVPVPRSTRACAAAAPPALRCGGSSHPRLSAASSTSHRHSFNEGWHRPRLRTGWRAPDSAAGAESASSASHLEMAVTTDRREASSAALRPSCG